MLINAFVKRELIFGDKRYFQKIKIKKKRKRDQIPLKKKNKTKQRKSYLCSKSINLETFYRRKKFTSFYISRESGIKIFKKRFINKYYNDSR